MADRSFEARVAAVRHFTRFWTRRLGHLQDGLLQSPFSLTEAHVLYELTHRRRATASELGRDLGLDPGYLSRILRRFRQLGLVSSTQSSEDARQSLLNPTDRGRAAFSPLDRRSNELAGAMLNQLSAPDQHRFVGAMRTIERLLLSPEARKPPVLIRPHEPGDLGWIVSRHTVLYTQEYGWDDTFETDVVKIAATFLQNFDRQHERCWIAEVDGERTGAVAAARESKTMARLRFLFLEPQARGLGIGRRLVAECVGFAREAGYRAMMLTTYNVLTHARAIYRDAGFRLVDKRQEKAYGQNMAYETWQMKL